jgi:hypothetical protein
MPRCQLKISSEQQSAPRFFRTMGVKPIEYFPMTVLSSIRIFLHAVLLSGWTPEEHPAAGAVGIFHFRSWNA